MTYSEYNVETVFKIMVVFSLGITIVSILSLLFFYYLVYPFIKPFIDEIIKIVLNIKLEELGNLVIIKGV